MKKLSNPAALGILCTAGGLLCLAARLWLVTAGVDHKGLLIPGHPGDLLSWLTAAAVAAVMALALWGQKPKCRFVPSLHSCAGTLAMTVGFAITAGELLAGGTVISLVTGIFGLVSALCGVYTAFCQYKGQRASLLIRCPAIVFFMLLLVCRYQLWSAEPQVQRYGFQLFALVCLTLAAYQRAALEGGTGSAVFYLAASRGAVFFCLAATAGSGHGVFYLLMDIATLLDGCRCLHRRPLGDQSHEPA